MRLAGLQLGQEVQDGGLHATRRARWWARRTRRCGDRRRRPGRWRPAASARPTAGGACRSRWRGERRSASASFATRSSAASPLTPVSLTTDRLRMRRTVQLRLSAESGFWNTICMARLSSAGRSVALAGQRVAVQVDARRRRRARGCRACVLARVRLARSPTRRPGRASRRRSRPRSTPTSAGTSWPCWRNVLDTSGHSISTTWCPSRTACGLRRPAARGSRRSGRRGGSG